MRPVRQAVVIADQVAMKFERGLDALASFPMIFADPGLNAELALDQVLPGVAFFIEVVVNAEPLIVTSPNTWRQVETKPGALLMIHQQFAKGCKPLICSFKRRRVERRSKLWRAVENG